MSTVSTVWACSPPSPRPPSSVRWAAGPAGPAGRPRPVVPRALPATAAVSRAFDRHVLDGADVRAALLELVVS
ncbi:hypothetical protein ACFV29_43095 [Streptomyces sp. NPDC059690]|uniref:hypothetical protein n=1 Tax=Streptomyces sp. NPDC059690 TaxID=3346907 RepID=UPI0036BF87BA